MSQSPSSPNMPLQGVGRLAIKAVAEVTHLVESLHHTILRVTPPLSPPETRPAPGLTGFVYRRIRGVNHWVGQTLDPVLGKLDELLASEASLPMADAMRAVLNGIIGDELQASKNPLALPMTLRVLAADGLALKPGAMPNPEAARSKVVVFVHGLCMSEQAWQRKPVAESARTDAANLPHLFSEELGYTCLALNYNSGLTVAENGRLLLQQLDWMDAQWPKVIDELVLVGHSMGGLVCRSACLQAESDRPRWRRVLRSMIFLGSPHHGAPLERAGNWIDALLGGTAYTAPFARLGKMRSAGITDLRFGNLLDADRVSADRFASRHDQRSVTRLPDDVSCYVVAGLISASPNATGDRILGDGLVPLQSALGRHEDTRRSLEIPASRRAILRRCRHLQLLHDPRVIAQLRDWLRH